MHELAKKIGKTNQPSKMCDQYASIKPGPK